MSMHVNSLKIYKKSYIEYITLSLKIKFERNLHDYYLSLIIKKKEFFIILNDALSLNRVDSHIPMQLRRHF